MRIFRDYNSTITITSMFSDTHPRIEFYTQTVS